MKKTGAYHKWTDAEIAQIQKYADEGYSVAEVAQKIGVGANRRILSSMAYYYGIVFRRQNESLTIREVEKIRQYAAEGKTMTQVAKLLDCKFARVHYIATKHEISFSHKTTHVQPKKIIRKRRITGSYSPIREYSHDTDSMITPWDITRSSWKEYPALFNPYLN